ncbi:hypothetical protein PV08_03829 [Exophiala spinifera]|uniref:Myb-like DNA-binding domain-containing protein n=1 Tax=Exophiala spinifera TaxID=91928 RepID=A0A0D1YNH8_9EURO|nr:uncharacterized protein PV08_03829 [Exophiala spinifera]KIW16641.1 hypothetical protein PV08_03829 [Exophiala spinifera]
MAPKPAPADPAAPDPQLQFIFSALKHSESLKINWEEVAKENGIGYARNAASKFKNFVEKQGLKYENNAIRSAGDVTTSTTPKNTPSRKRKVKGEDDSEDQTPTKRKGKATAALKNEKGEDDEVKDEDTTEQPVKAEEAKAEEAKAEVKDEN